MPISLHRLPCCYEIVLWTSTMGIRIATDMRGPTRHVHRADGQGSGRYANANWMTWREVRAEWNLAILLPEKICRFYMTISTTATDMGGSIAIGGV